MLCRKDKTSFVNKKKEETAQYLKGIKALIVEQGLGKTRASILTKQLVRHGGTESKTLCLSTTHILVGKTMKLEKLPKILKVNEIEQNIQVVHADWLSSCLTEGRIVGIDGFSLTQETNDSRNLDCGQNFRNCEVNSPEDLPCTSGAFNASVNELSYHGNETNLKQERPAKHFKLEEDNESDSDYINSDSDDQRDSTHHSEISPHISPHKKSDKWICTKPSTSSSGNLNEDVIAKLQVLEKAYKNMNDQWRTLGYRKAIASVKNFPKKIQTLEECQSLPFVGERLAKKIWEIVETGHLQRLDHLDAKNDALELFCNLWGAGPKTAESWVAKGLRTLDDLQKNGNLNRQQQIGLQYYEEFLERMPRSEAEEIGSVVITCAKSLDPALQCEICGSFRRDFITDDLTSVDNKQHRKYFGVCLLPGDGRKVILFDLDSCRIDDDSSPGPLHEDWHRRLDIIVVPYSEWICSLIYFTGSDYLNRSMRLLARKKGMCLTEHSLNTGVLRKGEEKLSEGKPLPLKEEKEVFHYLGLDYLQPRERDW